MLDVVYPIRRTTDDCVELRHSLRTLANVPHGRVWLTGEPPRWATGVVKVTVHSEGDRYARVRANLRAVLDHPSCPSRFAVWNDDFFRLTPLDAYRPEHRGNAERLARTAIEKSASSYHQSLLRTVDLLAERGITAPLSYELHSPLVVDAHLLRLVLDRWAHVTEPWQWRTAYGNIARLGGTQVDDPKIHNGTTTPTTGWASSSPASWRGALGTLVRNRFATPSRYERPTTRQARA